MEQNEYDEIIRHLVGIATHQGTINEDLRAMLRTHDALFTQQEAIIERVTAAIERLDATQARIEALLTLMIPTRGNGREA